MELVTMRVSGLADAVAEVEAAASEHARFIALLSGLEGLERVLPHPDGVRVLRHDAVSFSIAPRTPPAPVPFGCYVSALFGCCVFFHVGNVALLPLTVCDCCLL